jgi:hypothetical protein
MPFTWQELCEEARHIILQEAEPLSRHAKNWLAEYQRTLDAGTGDQRPKPEPTKFAPLVNVPTRRGCGRRLGASAKACGIDGYWCGCAMERAA